MKAEELADKYFNERNEKQIRYAQQVYREQKYMTTRDALLNGFADEKDQEHAKWTMQLLETLFGKEQFIDIS